MAKKRSGGPTRSAQSAISLPIVNSLEGLAETSYEGFTELSNIMDSVLNSLKSLNTTFAGMLEVQREQLDIEKLNAFRLAEAEAEANARGERGEEKAEKVKAEKPGGLLGIIAAISGTLIGLVQGFFDSFKKTLTFLFGTFRKSFVSLFAGISMQFDLAKAWVGSNITKALDSIRKFLKIDDLIAGWKAELELFRPIIDRVKTVFKAIGGGFLRLGESVKEAKGIIMTVVGAVGKVFGFFKDIVAKIGGFLRTLSGVDTVFATIGRTIGKLFYPFTIIMSLIDTVTGAMQGYEDGGILGAIKGGITGLLSGLVAAPLDLLKNLVSWLAEAVGLDSFSEMLDSFSFVDLFKKVINGIFDGILETFATIADYIPGMGGVAEKLRGMKTKSDGGNAAEGGSAEAVSSGGSPAPSATPAASAATAAPGASVKVTEADRKTEAYQAILNDTPVGKPGDPESERARISRADQKYRKAVESGEIKQGGGDVQSQAAGAQPTRGAAVDRSSRQAAAAASGANVVVAPSNTSVNAPTVNNSNSTTMAPASPRPNSSSAGNFFVDPILGV